MALIIDLVESSSRRRTTYGVTSVGLGVLLSAAKLDAAVLLASTPLTCSDNY